jgi:hypothetical protein
LYDGDEEKTITEAASLEQGQSCAPADKQDNERDTLPFLCQPVPAHEAGKRSPWLRPGQEAVTWLSVFYGESKPSKLGLTHLNSPMMYS